MRLYCTHFDDGYFSRGAVMIDSLLEHDPDASVWVLALTPSVAGLLETRFADAVNVVALDRLEAAEPALPPLRSQRSAVEYIFTLTAPWTKFVMDEISEPGDWVTYLDADLYFFSSPEPVFAEIAGSSVALVEHRYPPTRRGLRRFGTYNVGWVGFRHDADGRRCLDWWSQVCLEWCFDRVEDGKFADQGYLDRFVDITSQLHVISNPGVDLAPWNLGRYRVDAVGPPPTVDGSPVVCFHFHGIWKRGDRYYWKNFRYHARTTRTVREALFRPYLGALSAAEREQGRAVTDSRVRGRLGRARSGVKRLAARAVGDTMRSFQDGPTSDR
ncbi:MAG: hypothetical protein U0R28_11570 [Candidatus Nanopelagicales bacterium]